jgi:ATP-dependent protease ClpP protease subunit
MQPTITVDTTQMAEVKHQTRKDTTNSQATQKHSNNLYSYNNIFQYNKPFITTMIKGPFDDELEASAVQSIYNSIKSGQGFVLLDIDSPGGCVMNLRRILVALDDAKLANLKVITYVRNQALSCGAILAAMGDIRIGHPLCKLMFHCYSMTDSGYVTQLAVDANMSLLDNKELLRLVSLNCGYHEDNKDYLFNVCSGGIGTSQGDDTPQPTARELWMTANEAVKFNILHHSIVLEVQLNAVIKNTNMNPAWDIDSNNSDPTYTSCASHILNHFKYNEPSTT